MIPKTDFGWLLIADSTFVIEISLTLSIDKLEEKSSTKPLKILDPNAV